MASWEGIQKGEDGGQIRLDAFRFSYTVLLMKTLLAKDSALYLKRLVRELNSEPHGFYVYAVDGSSCFRSNRARIHKGQFQVIYHSNAIKPKWVGGEGKVFVDAYAREIVASRAQ